MDRKQARPAKGPKSTEKHDPPESHANNPKLGREIPGRGLDTGFDTGAIQPGKTGGAAPLN